MENPLEPPVACLSRDAITPNSNPRSHRAAHVVGYKTKQKIEATHSATCFHQDNWRSDVSRAIAAAKPPKLIPAITIENKSMPSIGAPFNRACQCCHCVPVGFFRNALCLLPNKLGKLGSYCSSRAGEEVSADAEANRKKPSGERPPERAIECATMQTTVSGPGKPSSV